MASTVWKGYLTFGLISIPIKLFAAARSGKISFNQLHKKCNTRIKQQTWCPACDEIVPRSDIVKGYEYATDSYVLVSDEEIKKLAPPSAETMEILEFVKLSEIDPLHYDSSYYTVPEAPGRKPYQLLVDTMEDSGHAAIAKIAMHQREYTVLIRPRRGGLTLHTMYYADDIREVEGYGRQSGVELKPQEVELAKKLVESLAASFQPEKYRDDYQVKLREMIEAKQRGEEVATAEPRRMAPIIDMMEALQKSLAMTAPAPKKPAAREEAREEAAKAPQKRRRVKTGAAG